jgi:hypothetical protein
MLRETRATTVALPRFNVATLMPLQVTSYTLASSLECEHLDSLRFQPKDRPTGNSLAENARPQGKQNMLQFLFKSWRDTKKHLNRR